MELIALIMTHVLCNEMAATQVLSASKALECSANFEQVKIGLNPDFTWEEFQALDPSERAEMSVKSYQYYVDWKAQNISEFRKMVKDAKMTLKAAI